LQAVILAAGAGQRLKPLTNALPKGLIEIVGKTLLEYSLDALDESGLKDIVIVTGFFGEAIKRKFGNKYAGLKITYVLNEEYYKSGSMYSFSKAKDAINSDILLLESDLLYDPKAIGILLNSGFKDCVLAGKLSGSGDEVYICVDDDQRITELGKEISCENKKKAVGELIGISKFSKEFLAELFKTAEKDYAKGEVNRHYEECVLATAKSGRPVHGLLISGLIWTEIDNEKDLLRAKSQIYPKIKKISKK
jgi:2-aminoethylphosphonate-pyruvate transaminase